MDDAREINDDRFSREKEEISIYERAKRQEQMRKSEKIDCEEINDGEQEKKDVTGASLDDIKTSKSKKYSTEYYMIEQKENVRNAIFPKFPTSTEIWKENRPIFIEGKTKKTTEPEELVYLPLYASHTYLISNEIKDIWEKYQLGGRYRPCAMGSVEHRIAKPYWFMLPRILEAVHENTKYYKNNDIQELHLDKKIINFHHVFGIRHWHHTALILSESILEEMLQKQITEFKWEKVEIN